MQEYSIIWDDKYGMWFVMLCERAIASFLSKEDAVIYIETRN